MAVTETFTVRLLYTLYKWKERCVSDKTAKRKIPIKCYLLYNLCRITLQNTKQRQQLSRTLLYVEHWEKITCQIIPQKKNINFVMLPS
jgi:hypothetical protein